MSLTIATLNPRTWGMPAYVVTMCDGAVDFVVQQSYSAKHSEFDIDWAEYDVEHYPVDTLFVELDADAYPEDDPGMCFYEYFKPTRS